MGKLYSGWFELGEFLKGATSDFRQLALDKWLERWAYGHRGVSAAAYVLDPEFNTHDQGSNTEVTEGFMETLEKFAVLMEVRRREASSDELQKLWKQRSEVIANDPKSWAGYTHYPTYPTSSTPEVKALCRKVSEQLVIYRNRKGVFLSSPLHGFSRPRRLCLRTLGGMHMVQVCLSCVHLPCCCYLSHHQRPFASELTLSLRL